MAETCRRSVLAAAGAAVLVAGCGGGGGDDGPSPTAGDPTAGDPTETGTPTGGAGGEQLTSTAEVPVGGGVILREQRIVVTQPEEGRFEGFSAVCTHQQCLVGSVTDGAIVCPCHGSRFAVADGAVLTGPATRPLPAEPITVAGGTVLRA